MNLLFCCGDYYPNTGGATTLVDDLAASLLSRGHEVTVLTRMHAGLARQEQHHGYDIERFNYPMPYEKLEWERFGLLRSALVLWRVSRIIRKRRIETVCIGLLDMSAWYIFWLRRVLRFRLVVYLHGGETRALPAQEASYAALLRSALGKADAVIAVSEQLKDEAGQLVPAARTKIEVIVNAIDLRHIRATQGLAHPRPYFAAVGRSVYEKDFATLIRAYSAVQGEIGEVDLILAGAGKQETMLRELAAECSHPERVIFLGRTEREESLAVMKGAMFFVLPSVTEGLPIVAIEALALGTPVLGSRIPGIQAVVEEGRHGNLVAPGDVTGLSCWLRRYCLDEEHRRRMSEGAAEIDLDRYDMDLAVESHLRVYRGDR